MRKISDHCPAILIVACLLALAGCTQPPAATESVPATVATASEPSSSPSSAAPSAAARPPLTEATRLAGTEAAQEVAEALGDERRATDYAAVGDPGRYRVAGLAEELARAKPSFALDTTLSGQLSQRLSARAQARAGTGDATLSTLAAALAAAPATADSAGETHGASITLSHGASTATLLLVRTVKSLPFYSFVRLEQDTPGGDHRLIQRTATLGPDGRATVRFHRERGRPDGTTLRADWTETVAADGELSGSGVLGHEPKGGSPHTTTLSIGGTDDAPHITFRDAEHHLAGDVSLPLTGEASAELTESGGDAGATLSLPADAGVGDGMLP